MIYRLGKMKNEKFKKIAYDWMKFRKNIIWNVGCKIFMKVEIWKKKKKKEKQIKMEGQTSLGGGGGGFLNF